MNVSPTSIRDEVREPSVDLDAESLTEQTHRASAYTSGRGTFTQGPNGQIQYPPFYHYEQARIPILASGSTRQIPAVHEFGHMIGLGDEYVMSAEDLAVVERAHGVSGGEDAMRERNRMTDRVMNSGGRVAPDHYRPFAAWLSGLTHTEWRVGSAVPPLPATPPARPVP